MGLMIDLLGSHVVERKPGVMRRGVDLGFVGWSWWVSAVVVVYCVEGPYERECGVFCMILFKRCDCDVVFTMLCKAWGGVTVALLLLKGE